MQLYRMAILFLPLLSCMQTELYAEETTKEPESTLQTSEKRSTHTENNVSTIPLSKKTAIVSVVDKEVKKILREPVVKLEVKSAKVLKVLSLEEENQRLKEKTKVLESKLKALKKEGEEGLESRLEIPTKTLHVAKKIFKGKRLKLGGKAPQKLSTYYVANYQGVGELKAKLEANGFRVLAVTPILKGKTVITVTNEELLKTNTWMATLHLLVNEGEEVRIQNPSYFGAAYLQDNFHYGQFRKTLQSFQNVLGEMYTVTDTLELSDLPSYQFMFGMPYLNDTITVAEGKRLFQKVQRESVKKYIAYLLKLPNGTILVGHRLQPKTNTFLEKIHVAHDANILPYESMIQGTKAVMLDPKYYLALSLPLVPMSDFMKIASTPGEIEKEIKKVYQ